MGDKMKTYSLKLIFLASLLAVAGCAGLESDYRLYLAFGSDKSEIGKKDGYARGKTHFQNGKFGLAIEAFHAALLNEGRSVDTLNGLGAAYDNLGRFDLARRYYNEALALEPNSAITLHNLGYSHLLQGNLSQALQSMRAAYDADTENRVIRHNLEMVSAMSQRKQAATQEALAHSKDQEGDASAPPEAWIQRDSEAVQSLVTAPRVEFLAAVQKARIDPRLVAYEASQDDWIPQFLSAGIEEARGPTLHQRHPAAPPLLIEVSNGYGRRHMAARMARHLRAEGFRRARLTNQEAFDRETSVIYCRVGYEAWARQLVGHLPLPVPIVARPELGWSDVVLVLGADLSDFDQALLMRFAEEDMPPRRQALEGNLLEDSIRSQS